MHPLYTHNKNLMIRASYRHMAQGLRELREAFSKSAMQHILTQL